MESTGVYWCPVWALREDDVRLLMVDVLDGPMGNLLHAGTGDRRLGNAYDPIGYVFEFADGVERDALQGPHLRLGYEFGTAVGEAGAEEQADRLTGGGAPGWGAWGAAGGRPACGMGQQLEDRQWSPRAWCG